MTDSFIFHKTINVIKLVNIVKNFDSEWSADVSRQNTYHVHRHTSTILITDFDLNWKCFSTYNYQPIINNEQLFKTLNPTFEYLKQIHNGEIGRSMFVKLPARKTIDKHFDSGEYLILAKRHHIPIITNSKVWFNINGVKKHLKKGEIWEIDNTKEHEVQNLGKKDRIHLIIDIIPRMYLNN